ncbi:DUF4175 domain-containing protein [Celeribacter sp.]|uniref:DUF4175 domain-containing protein n=1 Tax=Celeribacter sp. TaxID=1890673 RepID=UPI003A8EADC5
MDYKTHLPKGPATRVKRAIRATYAGVLFEHLSAAFWPFFSVLVSLVGLALLGVHEVIPSGLRVFLFMGAAAFLVVTLGHGVWRFRWPAKGEAVARVDATLKGRPLQALSDTPLSGAADPASQAIWAAHLDRMAARAAAARAVAPPPDLPRHDPFGLRLMALTVLGMGLLFGSLDQAKTVAIGRGADQIAMGPVWEGWVKPPAFTGKPTLYLADLNDAFEAPKGSEVTVRLYGDGDSDALSLRETVSGSGESEATDFSVVQSGDIEIDGPTGRLWSVALVPDAPPVAELVDAMTRAASGETRQGFRLSDDFGVARAVMVFERDIDAVTRHYGFVVDPEPRADLAVEVTLPQTGDRTEIEGVFAENFSQHPFAGLPVMVSLRAYDQTGQVSEDAIGEGVLPSRRFFDPLAAALIDVRRELLWNRANASRAAQVLRAVSFQPEDLIDDDAITQRLRDVIAKLEGRGDPMSDALVDEIATDLWEIANLLEDGQLSEALERLRRAQERLQQAMRDGASDEEIARLMQELREATQDYIQQLAEQQGEDESEQPQGETQQMSADQLQQLMDRIQELMEQGRMAEAQQMMDMLNQLLENMRVTQDPNGQGGEGNPSMQGMQDMLREQQDLNDDTFSDLQEQQDQREQGEGQAQADQGENQEGQDGEGADQNGAQGQAQNEQGEDGAADMGDLSDRQRALRRELERQLGNVPSGENAEGIGEALEDAGRAMDDAEQALRENDLAGALDSQAEALEALREGMRQLGDQLAQGQPQEQEGQQGQAGGADGAEERRDPLGRTPGNTGRFGSDEEMAEGEDVYRRAEELLDEIRRRSAEQNRPEEERDYLNRLLDRF